MTGSAGESEVAGKFERLGWGVAPNPKHDLGTDLWLMARDARLFDLGLVVGAQVKTGPSWFREPEADEKGELVGWWFRSDREHVDAWIDHRLPHVVVLHDLEANVSYWAQVTRDGVVGTGKHVKLLVPTRNTVDETQRDELLRVAASERAEGTWEGSAWTGAAVTPTALLRHALLVPRLIAPHPNLGHATPVTAPQALALVVQARLRDLVQHSEQHDAVPAPDSAHESEDWDWRLVGAMWQRVTTGAHDGLAAAAVDGPDPARRAAAAIAAAATMIEDGLADRALAVLDAVLEGDDCGPVDHAWLLVQKSRALVEVGRREEARDLAARAQVVGSTHASDVTATAVAGASAVLLFMTADWGATDLPGVIAGADNVVAWWRTQTVSFGLTALTERTFREWARGTGRRLAFADDANDQLLAAALTASYLGDHGSWRRLSELLGMDGLLRLDRHDDPEKARTALETLRMAGSSDELASAIRRLADDGPASAITLVAAELDLDKLTHTTAPPTLTLLERGGDLMDQVTTDKAVGWLLATLAEPDGFIARTRPTYLVDMRLVDALAGVVRGAGAGLQRQVAERLASLSALSDQALATSWARVVHALPNAAWSPSLARAAGAAAERHHWALRTALLGVAAVHEEPARQRLLVDARSGDMAALGALGDVRDLPPEVASDLVEALAGHVRGQVEKAHQGSFGFGYDHARALALLNLWHPDSADWEPLVALIGDPVTVAAHKRGALRLLAGAVERVPEHVRAGLRAAAEVAASAPPRFRGLLGEDDDRVGPAVELLTALTLHDESADDDRMVQLLNGETPARRSAARIAGRHGRPVDVGLLLALAATEHDPLVRAEATVGLARVVAEGGGGAAARAAVRGAAQDPGRLVPEAVAAVLSGAGGLSPELTAVRDQLRTHPSARVRRAAAARPAP